MGAGEDLERDARVGHVTVFQALVVSINRLPWVDATRYRLLGLNMQSLPLTGLWNHNRLSNPAMCKSL